MLVCVLFIASMGFHQYTLCDVSIKQTTLNHKLHKELSFRFILAYLLDKVTWLHSHIEGPF